jgi:predicted RNA-binding Zn-ribbon protein involved in translation (DUF1610 family)
MQDSSVKDHPTTIDALLVRPELVQVTDCPTCGQSVVWATTCNGHVVDLTPAPPARWLLAQRHDDGLFAPCGSVAPGFILHRCPAMGIDARREVKARKLAAALHRSRIAAADVADFDPLAWAMAEHIAGIHPSSDITRALATGYLVAMEVAS